MFCDIVGFTAWSSTREPAQIFTLLETIFSAFDEIASLRGVFKVGSSSSQSSLEMETILTLSCDCRWRRSAIATWLLPVFRNLARTMPL